MIQPSFAEFQRLSKQGNLIPVYDVFSADLLTPVSAYLRIAQGARHSFLLESVEGGEKIARYTFAGANPEEVFRYANGACVLESHDRIVWEEKDPVTFLRARIERFKPVRLPGLPPLVAGAHRNRQPLGIKVLTGVAGGDFDLVGLAAQTNDVVSENDFRLCHGKVISDA